MSNGGRFITLDTETRALEDVTVVGPARYFEDPFVEMLCLCWSFGMDEEVFVWHCATEGIEESPFPKDLFRYIEKGWLVEAHNVMFERRGMEMQAKRRGWPIIPVSQLRCSAAKAAYHALPRSLEALAETLRVTQRKDPEGKQLIKDLSGPIILAEPKKAKGKGAERWEAALAEMDFAESMGEKPKHFWLPDGRIARWNENPDRIRRNWEYCQQDVRTERDCSLEMPELPDCELKVWQMDQEMNYRGIQCDLELARAAIDVAEAEVSDLNFDLQLITGIAKGSQKDKVREWLNAKMGWQILPNMQAETVDRVFARPDIKKEHPEFHEVLTIYRKVNRTSTKKYNAVLLRVCADGRVRDTLMYSGAHTTRWTGKGLQPQNMPRGLLKLIELAAETIKSRDRRWMRFLYGDVMLLLSHALRGMFIAGEGKELWVADYAAVEARIVFWLAQCFKALAIFKRKEDIYCDLASKIYRYTVTKANEIERKFGKEGILGLGFGMGFCKFLLQCRKYRITFTREQVIGIMGRERYFEIGRWILTSGPLGGFNQVVRAGLATPRVKPEQNALLKKNLHELILAKYVVDLYRTEYKEVPDFWDLQEWSAVEAVKTRGRVEAGMITWEFIPGRVPETNRLVAHLPSGRDQTYWDPRLPSKAEKEKAARLKAEWVAQVRARGGDPELEVYPGPIISKLRYMQIDEDTFEFVSTHTYGGKITENLVQHVARDAMADAMLRIEGSEAYENLLCVHDEPVTEADKGKGMLAEFERLIAESDGWAKTCPITVEVWTGPRYKKA